MKLPITDKFLWDLYGLLEKTGNIIDFALSNKYRQASILVDGLNPVIDKYQKEMGKREFSKLIYYLKRKNYIKSQNLRGKKAIILTKEGLGKTLKASFKTEHKTKRRDGKWIMLTFDIPIQHKKARALLRSILNNLEYKMFQQSIWVSPFDISSKTERLLQAYSLDGYVKIFLIEELWDSKQYNKL